MRTVDLLLFTIFFILFSQQIGADSNSIHPSVSLLDEAGRSLLSSGGNFSAEKSCGSCHDTKSISDNNHHSFEKLNIDCVTCHFKGGKLDFKTDSNELSITRPQNENCSICHSFYAKGRKPLEISKEASQSEHFALKTRTGEIFSHQKMFHSFLNLQNKESLTDSWDIHAERGVQCVDCHFSSNNPKKNFTKKTNELSHLKSDPRAPSIAEFLKKPDHNLTTVQCSHCHTPQKIHDMLPYKKKHLERLACQSCHVPSLKAPVLLEIDETSMSQHNTPLYRYRNTDNADIPSLNAVYTTSFSPFLYPDEEQLKPYNFVTHWTWLDKSNHAKIDKQILANIFSPQEDERKQQLLAVFDVNKNGILENSERRLDTQDKLNFIKNQLKASGSKEPQITGKIHAYPVGHGIIRGKNVVRNCSFCHSKKSRLDDDIPLGLILPGRNTPQFDKSGEHLRKYSRFDNTDTHFRLQRDFSKSNFYVFGFSRDQWPDILGILSLVLTLLGIGIHAGIRIYQSGRIPTHHSKTRKVYMYSFYERLWHWTMAFGIMILLLTGFKLHFPNSLSFLNFTFSVYIHNIIAFIVIVNAGLSLFYHLTSKEIKQFLPPMGTFWPDSIAQIKYYTQGIFKGEPHPLEKTPEHKLNPLQQITYLGILNFLLPLQVITGLLIWGAERWPKLLEGIGGLSFISPIHTLGSWFFITFLVMHIYLTTTGHTWFANIRAMMFGFEDVERKNQ